MCYYSHCIISLTLFIWAVQVSALDFVANFHYLEFIFQAPVLHKKRMQFECENSGFGQIEIECSKKMLSELHVGWLNVI